ncbi:hypothetical protein CEF21_06950 [Bacillus sp. FJAT-42376]|uniref:hypothetical protein n=1 Tax=Bacillus sp. FJAT-42376 TaxID=2014076 RepID=UPI000F501F67|nr:hypothetical protein [Bacillus sp. FJAT-42376]AZB42047.1 hypothetical protein CEF21_06950 [Bacillus sp. FJAT-42376]
MKRVSVVSIVMLLIVSLMGCNSSQQSAKPGNISAADLTEREKTILSSAADHAFVFDFNAGGTYKQADVWVEKYVAGKLTGKINRISTEVKNNGTLIFTVSNAIEGTSQSLFSTAIHSDGTTFTGKGSEPAVDQGKAIVEETNPNDSIPIKGRMVLASICYSKEQEDVRSLSTDFYEHPERHMDELKSYDVIYLLRSEFK